MDLDIIITMNTDEELGIFDQRFQDVVAQTKEQVDIRMDAGEEAHQTGYTIKDYDQISNKFAMALGAFLGFYLLGGCTIKTTQIREDGPRYSHENGRFVNNNKGE